VVSRSIHCLLQYFLYCSSLKNTNNPPIGTGFLNELLNGYIYSYILNFVSSIIIILLNQHFMKKNFSLFLFLFTILFTCFAFAGTTSLTTYYPAPTAAYNKVKLSTNASYSTTPNTGYCGSTLTPLNNGAIFIDSSGNLNVCMNGQATSYPQECYNRFFSYDTSSPPAGATWSDYRKLYTSTNCQSGFIQVPVDGLTPSPNSYEQFQTSPHTVVTSIVCCSGTLSSGATYTPPTTTAPTTTIP